ncbi:DUF2306 domain-containing protein [Maribacter polysaccharolyticus]|uniref:DUF2306 domain-containing protein n=1 Tax=Maribacter polysaccharolyticus TaxID=3020831 RepID=UPI00237FB63F|nr:DUF2306 domain-containing protein [Maribacter polysaccharolyticus]MDE3741625.1 DUF2306 domain-containing protein [Maribacter polysaccharolyticus]
MKNTTNIVAWIVLGVSAVSIGLYPLLYFVVGREFGILPSKGEQLLDNAFWNIGFYGHIVFGGVALLIGWVQFSEKIRNTYIKLHKGIGKLYVISVLISAVCGGYIAFFATGGIVSTIGFASLALIWLFYTLRGYLAVRNKDLSLHKGFMIYSYAATFAAVTLRIWLPILHILFDDHIVAYRIVSWLCWVPNIVFAFFWVRKRGLVIG